MSQETKNSDNSREALGWSKQVLPKQGVGVVRWTRLEEEARKHQVLPPVSLLSDLWQLF